MEAGQPRPEQVETETDPDRPSTITEDAITDVDERDEVIPVRYSITSYGADFLVDGLVSRLRSGDIAIPSFDPEYESNSGVGGFQRAFIWNKRQADGFVESLLLGLPVPGIFLVSEPSGVLLVLDGQQRLRTLQSFYDGVFRGREFSLSFVQPEFRGRTYKSLEGEDRRRLDNSIIHATVVRQDEPSDGQGAIYQIFERLNTGGTLLQPHEIRVALFRGGLLTLLRDLNTNDNWRTLIGPPSARLKDQELILRFFALLDEGDDYRRPMVGFLNQYMDVHRDPNPSELARLRSSFADTVQAITQGIGSRAFRPTASVNAAVADSVMVGVATRLAAGEITDLGGLTGAYDRLLTDEHYKAVTERATADEESVRSRLALTRAAFSTVV